MNKPFCNKIKKTMSAILAATVSLSMMAATPVYADWVEKANNAEEVAITDDIFEIQRRACEAHELLYASFDWNETYIYPFEFFSYFIWYIRHYFFLGHCRLFVRENTPNFHNI